MAPDKHENRDELIHNASEALKSAHENEHKEIMDFYHQRLEKVLKEGATAVQLVNEPKEEAPGTPKRATKPQIPEGQPPVLVPDERKAQKPEPAKPAAPESQKGIERMPKAKSLQEALNALFKRWKGKEQTGDGKAALQEFLLLQKKLKESASRTVNGETQFVVIDLNGWVEEGAKWRATITVFNKDGKQIGEGGQPYDVAGKKYRDWEKVLPNDNALPLKEREETQIHYRAPNRKLVVATCKSLSDGHYQLTYDDGQAKVAELRPEQLRVYNNGAENPVFTQSIGKRPKLRKQEGAKGEKPAAAIPKTAAPEVGAVQAAEAPRETENKTKMSNEQSPPTGVGEGATGKIVDEQEGEAESGETTSEENLDKATPEQIKQRIEKLKEALKIAKTALAQKEPGLVQRGVEKVKNGLRKFWGGVKNVFGQKVDKVTTAAGVSGAGTGALIGSLGGPLGSLLGGIGGGLLGTGIGLIRQGLKERRQRQEGGQQEEGEEESENEEQETSAATRPKATKKPKGIPKEGSEEPTYAWLDLDDKKQRTLEELKGLSMKKIGWTTTEKGKRVTYFGIPGSLEVTKREKDGKRGIWIRSTHRQDENGHLQEATKPFFMPIVEQQPKLAAKQRASLVRPARTTEPAAAPAKEKPAAPAKPSTPATKNENPLDFGRVEGIKDAPEKFKNVLATIARLYVSVPPMDKNITEKIQNIVSQADPDETKTLIEVAKRNQSLGWGKKLYEALTKKEGEKKEWIKGEEEYIQKQWLQYIGKANIQVDRLERMFQEAPSKNLTQEQQLGLLQKARDLYNMNGEKNAQNHQEVIDALNSIEGRIKSRK